MINKKTEVLSKGETKKKFKMPKFPAAVVILFGVLLFMVLLSWVPHKGWVDTENPLFYFTQEGLFGPNSVFPFATWENPEQIDWNNIEGTDLTLVFSTTGVSRVLCEQWLAKFLGNFENIKTENIDKIVASILNRNGGILISEIDLASDWNLVDINYSSLSFTVSLVDPINDDGISYLVDFDKVFAIQTLEMDEGTNIFTLNILSLSVTTANGKNIEGLENISSIAIGPEWYNFWESNYYVGSTSGKYGLLDIPFVIVAGMFKATGLIFFLICIGAFLEVMTASGTLEVGTSALVKKMNGKELLLIPLLFTIFNIGGSTFGMSEETLGLIPLIIPFLVLAGFDTMTGLLIVVVGTTTGMASGLTDPFSVGVMSSSLQVAPAKDADIILGIGTGIPIRIVLFFVYYLFGVSFVTLYAWRAKKGKDYVAEPDMYEENKEWAQQMIGESDPNATSLSKRQTWGLIVFIITFGIMVFALLPWINWFEVLEDSMVWTGFSSIFFAKLLFGQWFFVQLGFLFLVVAFILGKVFGMKQKETNKAVVDGMKGMSGVAKILILARSVAIVFTYSGLVMSMIALILGNAEGGGSGAPLLIVWVLAPVEFLFVSFIPSSSGVGGILGPIIGPIIWGIGEEAHYAQYAALVIAVHTVMHGSTMMFMPTTGLVVAQSQAAKVNFGKALPILACCSIVTMLIGMSIISSSALIMNFG